MHVYSSHLRPAMPLKTFRYVQQFIPRTHTKKATNYTCHVLHPVSITRFPLTRFSPGSGLLRNPFFHRQWLRFSRVWVRKDGNLVMETGCSIRQWNKLCCVHDRLRNSNLNTKKQQIVLIMGELLRFNNNPVLHHSRHAVCA